ncbi:hypothetical protein GTV32_18010 [Gordonia sp. SID5947]|uniref:hypothetical protein n=1 Tax=Gordonia sp. SID5947 TaxID=2690315 RepID=UPI00136CF59F|nr:hypothetical protein [Gordonia sp. SID5947]MYR08079.1 hypothetical protein [Gordonia sp. SID5947]
MSRYNDDDDGYRRGFGRYLDDDMASRPHDGDEAERERETRGKRPPRDVVARGFGRYVTD